MHKKWIVANWKANPASVAEARELMSALGETLAGFPQNQTIGLIVCPPFIFLEEVAAIIQKSPMAGMIIVGAQDIAVADSPAQTGEITGAELVKLGVRYVIVGHSDRRKLGESDDVVNKKLKTTLAHNLTPIICVGERERDADFQQTLKKQVHATCADLTEQDIARCVMAYEPVWAISTTPGARADTPESALQSITVIQEALGTRPAAMLYGGSVTDVNVIDFLSQSFIDGVLVGGASIRKDIFGRLVTRAHTEL